MLLKDGIRTHPKILRAGAEAVWFWVAAIDYCRQQLTDGFLPMEVIHTLGSFKEKPFGLAERAVSVGLLEHAEGGYRIHDYLDHNDSAEEVRTKKERGRHRKGTWRSQQKTADVPPLSHGDITVPDSSLSRSKSVPLAGARGVGSGVGTKDLDLDLDLDLQDQDYAREARSDVGAFLEEWPQIVTKATGRPHPLEVGPRYWPDAQTLIATFGLARCRLLAEALHSTPHWDGKPRTIGMLRALAPEIDRWLIEHPGVPFRAPLQSASTRSAQRRASLEAWAAREETS